MPVIGDVPEPLRQALEEMETKVQGFKQSIAFAAPEAMYLHYIELQKGLAQTMATLYEEVSKQP